MTRDRRKREDVSLPENYFDLLRQQAVDPAAELRRLAEDRRTLQPILLTGRQPNPALLFSYLRDAQFTRSDVQRDGRRIVELRRVKAVRALHSLWLQWEADKEAVRVRQLSYWVEKDIVFPLLRERWMKRGAPRDFDRWLQDFFGWSGRAILSSPNPLVAMRIFWKGAPGSGRTKETNAERNFSLTLAVQKHVNAGMSIEEASAVVGANASPRRLSEEAVHKIYKKWRREAQAYLWLVALLLPEP